MSVRSSLEQHFGNWLATQSPAIPTAWENAAFTPPASGTAYARAFLMPAARYGASLCALEESGIMQVSLVYPANTGTGAVTAKAESLCTHFAPGKYAGFSIRVPPYYSQGIPTDDGRYMIPVSIFYAADL